MVRNVTMRRLLAPLSTLALTLALVLLLAGVEMPRLALPRLDALLHPVLAPGAVPGHAIAPLPRVLPFPHDPLRPPPGTTAQASGTGFFAAPHIVVTAAHVVVECQAIRLVSRHLPATEARLVAIDAEHDIAVLHTTATAPAHLAIASGTTVPDSVLVYGYPIGAHHDTPATARARLVNASVGGSTNLEINPRNLLWLQNREIAQGYSGGPVLNPADGSVIGIIRALIDPRRAASAYGIATPDLSIGPGTAPLRAMLGAMAEAAAPSNEDILTRTAKATVNVLCWQ